MADAIDDADGIDRAFKSGAHPDHPCPCSAFTRERDLDAQRPQERLRPPQSTGERPWRFWPTGAFRPSLVTDDPAGTQQVCGALQVSSSSITIAVARGVRLRKRQRKK